MFKRSSGWTWLTLLGLLALFLFLNWNSFNAPFERDEGHYAYGSWLLTKGLSPYIDTFEQKPPMIFYPYLLSVWINPDALWAPRLLAALSIIFTLILIGTLTAKEYGRRTGFIAVWLALVMLMYPRLTLAANTERFMLLPLIGALALYVFNRGKEEGGPWFWFGFCGMIAVLYKQIAAPAVAFIFLVWLFESRARLKGSLYALSGALFSLLLFTGYFILRGALPYFIESAIEYNKYYLSSTGGLTLFWFLEHLKVFLRDWSVLFILFLWLFAKRPKRWWFYSGLMLVSLLTIFTSPYGHYYLLLIPFWAIVSALSLHSLLEQLKVSLKIEEKYFSAVTFLLALVVLGSMLWPVYRFYLASPNEMVNRIYSPMNPFVEAPLAAARIKQLTGPDDYLFIAGTEPEINYYAKRRHPTRLLGMYGLMMDQPRNLDYQKEMVRDLERHPPRAIVWVQSPLSWLVQPGSPDLIFSYLHQLLHRKYRLVGGTVRMDGAAQWEEPADQSRLGKYSLLLFQEKGKLEKKPEKR